MWPDRRLVWTRLPYFIVDDREIHAPATRGPHREIHHHGFVSADNPDTVLPDSPVLVAHRSNLRQFATPDSESDDEAFQDNRRDASVDLLLFTSIETYTTIQRPTPLRPLPCNCLQGHLVPTPNMASSSVIEQPTAYASYPRIIQSSSSPERMSVRETLAEGIEDEFDPSVTSPSRYAPSSLSENSSASPTQQAIDRLKKCHIKETIIPDPVQARLRLRSIKKMAQPSNVAKQVANRVIKYARCIRNVYEKDLCCLNCGLFPICPITGPCGHTRCTKCVRKSNTCPCGNNLQKKLFINILIRDMIGKTTSNGPSSRIVSVAAKSVKPDDNPAEESSDTETMPDQPAIGMQGSYIGPIRLKSKARACISTPTSGFFQRIPMSPQTRYNYALELIQSKRYHEAAPQLALAAASARTDLRPARTLLAQVISILSQNRDPRVLTRGLNRSVRHLSSPSWIKQTDVECVLCGDVFTSPVTTPCGHMFCRTCIERTMDYKKQCPLCLRCLRDFKLTDTEDTVFVQAALRSINAVKPPPPLEPDLIPIFVCTVAYPSVPCPLFIFDPRYWLMIRRVLESGSRKFGMVACDRGQEYTDYGTILEVRDCVHLEDGRSILSTVGLSRFKVIERGVRDGCEIARILPIIDVPPSDVMDVWDLKVLASQILFKALIWLHRLNNKVLADIEAAFGRIPSREQSNEEWWESSDGPSWLWWLVAVLPLRSEIKVLILSTDCLLKRMMAVARTLDAVDQVTLTTAAPTQCQIDNSVSTNSQAIQ